MQAEVQVLIHSSIRIAGEQIVYFDPFQVDKLRNDADIVCITHEHHDHFSPEDIAKVRNEGTVFLCPESMKHQLMESGIAEDFIETVRPGDSVQINNVEIEAVPSYNVGKQFHPKEKEWVGYILSMNGQRFYVAGDTDLNEDVRQVQCDVALLPAGGKYTCDAREAAEFALAIHPKLAIPMHYSVMEGKENPGDVFEKLLEGKLEVLRFF